MLKYNGKGYYPGIPAKDLNEQEVEQFGGVEFLLSTGLYYLEKAPQALAEKAPQAPKPTTAPAKRGRKPSPK